MAVGIHPKHAAKLTEKDWSAFEAALALSGVSALGEVGLDYTSQPSTWGIQHSVLHRALEYLRPDHVLVLHNRPDKRNAGDDMLQLLFQLKGCIQTEQRIHLHCFSGSQYAVNQWSRHFPNTHFGLTQKCWKKIFIDIDILVDVGGSFNLLVGPALAVILLDTFDLISLLQTPVPSQQKKQGESVVRVHSLTCLHIKY
ncbi:putative deoxyribonuclease TATDN2 [Mya arenaria]|uniref:putative deoxyribonuclease TATDN2 n=1 Tax=Mya arenaria TaxID=6604 RepID=UPI0022E5FD9C|nr:putative deoxyribonuclease TATDN2 [Mya arenaria]